MKFEWKINPFVRKSSSVIGKVAVGVILLRFIVFAREIVQEEDFIHVGSVESPEYFVFLHHAKFRLGRTVR